MIKGKIKIKRTLDNLRDRITDYEIYRFYVGEFKPGTNISSPFRQDSNPSFNIYPSPDGLRHIDYGNQQYMGGCIDFVQQLFNLDFKGAINKIWDDLLDDQGRRKHIITNIPKIEQWRKLIQITPVAHGFKSLEYWGKYHLSSNDLSENSVVNIEHLWVDKTLIPNLRNSLRFGYIYDNYAKIYQPEAEDSFKFISNVPIDYISGLTKLIEYPNVIITKSKKDEMVLRKVYPNVCSVQSENIRALREDQINYFKTNYKRVILNFDNDKTGRDMSKYFQDTYNLETLFVPDSLHLKDFADVGKTYGLTAVEEVLKKEGVYV